MKKWIFCIIVFAGTTFSSFAQQGSVELKAGAGAPNWGGIIFRVLPDGIQNGKMFVPLSGSINYYVSDHFSIGLYGAHTRGNSDLYQIQFNVNDSMQVTGTGSLHLYRTTIGIRPEFHLGNHERFDPFIGATLAYRNTKLKAEYDVDADFDEISNSEAVNDIIKYLSGFGLNKGDVKLPVHLPAASIYFGGRYLITPNVGLYTEIGLGGTFLANAGVAVKF